MSNHPPNCRCGGAIQWDEAGQPYPVDTDGDSPPGHVNFKGVCEDCGKEHVLQYAFCEAICPECWTSSEDCTGTKSGCKPGTKA